MGEELRKVRDRGDIAWRGHRHVFLSETLIGEYVGLKPVDERWYIIYFAQFPLARFDSRTWTVHRLTPALDLYIADAEKGEPPPSSALHPQNPDQNLSTMSPV